MFIVDTEPLVMSEDFSEEERENYLHFRQTFINVKCFWKKEKNGV
jgi:hypothetical protein